MIKRVFRKCLKWWKMRPRYRTYGLAEIILKQNYEFGYNRWDTVVRLLAAENEIGLNNVGWDLYRKMQILRNHDSEEKVNSRITNYKKMIHDMVNYQRIPIVLDEELRLYDGSHRIALGILNNRRRIKCMIDPTLGRTDTEYGEKWFAENGFNEEEMELIRRRVDQLISKYKQL